MDARPSRNISNRSSRREDAKPYEQGKTGSHLCPRWQLRRQVEFRSLLIDASAKDQRVNGNQYKEQQLRSKKGVVIIFFRFGTEQQEAERGGHNETDTLRNAQSIDYLRDRIFSQRPAQQAQIRHQNHSAKNGNRRKVERENRRIRVR